MLISDWNSDVCSSDLRDWPGNAIGCKAKLKLQFVPLCFALGLDFDDVCLDHILLHSERREVETYPAVQAIVAASHQSFFLELVGEALDRRSEEHTSELQSLMRISYAVFCLKKKKNKTYI